MDLCYCNYKNVYFDKIMAIKNLVICIRKDHQKKKYVEYYPEQLLNEKKDDYLYPESFRIVLLTADSILL